MKNYWQRLQPREQRLVTAAAIVLLAVVAWVGVWEPVREARDSAYRQLAEQRALLDWLDRIAPEVREARNQQGPQVGSDGRSTLALIDESARAAGLAGSMRRIEPAADDEVRVDFEQAPFPDLMQWLAELVGGQPFVVVRFDADRVGPGRVDSSVVLRRTDVGAATG